MSLVDRVSFVDRINWEADNKFLDFLKQIDAFRRRFGHDPASVRVDQIYRTRKNRNYCARRGIRLSGPVCSPTGHHRSHRRAGPA